MTNPFTGRALSPSGPATDLSPIVPSNDTDLGEVAVALYVETGGSVRVTTVRGEVRTVNVPDASIFPVGILRVHETGTTATGLHALMV